MSQNMYLSVNNIHSVPLTKYIDENLDLIPWCCTDAALRNGCVIIMLVSSDRR